MNWWKKVGWIWLEGVLVRTNWYAKLFHHLRKTIPQMSLKKKKQSESIHLSINWCPDQDDYHYNDQLWRWSLHHDHNSSGKQCLRNHLVKNLIDNTNQNPVQLIGHDIRHVSIKTHLSDQTYCLYRGAVKKKMQVAIGLTLGIYVHGGKTLMKS